MMEILSTGEKIKRARIYKGYTLKDLCEDKISVSKMSCIENDKVKIDKWVIELISIKLDLSVEYLLQGVRDQIIKNISKLSNSKNAKDYEQDLQYNLEYALEHMYYDLAFNIMHMLFGYYLNEGKVENVQAVNSRYYEVCRKSNDDNNTLLYTKDMASYFYFNKEYAQAATYYKNVNKAIKDNGNYSNDLLASVIYNEAACEVMLKNYKQANETAQELIELVEYVEDDIKKAEMYQMLALLSLRMDKENFQIYEKKSYEYYKNDNAKKAQAMYNFACSMFDVNLYEKAIKYINEGLGVYPDSNKENKVKYMLLCIGELVDRNIIDTAKDICDEALNCAINVDNIKFIEKAYYYKAMIFQKQGNYIGAEIYMNLSMDSLFKFGNRQDRFERYMEAGNMYFKLGQVSDSIKCFSLAMALEKKM